MADRLATGRPLFPERVDAGALVLREYVESDAPAVVEAVTANLEHLRPWMPWIAHEPMSVADRVALIRFWRGELRAGTNAIYGIFLDDDLIGGTGYHVRNGPGVVEIGYWLRHDHTGQGFATTSSRALTDHAFTIEGIDRVEIHHDVANRRSEAVPTRLGFRHVRDEVRAPQAPAETGVMRIWQMTADHWVPGRSGASGALRSRAEGWQSGRLRRS